MYGYNVLPWYMGIGCIIMGSMGVLVYVWQVGDVYVSLWVSGYGFMGGVGMCAFGWCVLWCVFGVYMWMVWLYGCGWVYI